MGKTAVDGVGGVAGPFYAGLLGGASPHPPNLNFP